MKCRMSKEYIIGPGACDHSSRLGIPDTFGIFMDMAAEHAELGVTACVAISAPMKTQAKFTFLARPLSLIKPQIAWQGGAGKRTDLMKAYNIGYSGFATARIYDLNYLMRSARKDLYAITCPLLAVQSHADDTVSADSAQMIYEGVQSQVKRILWLENVPHVCTISIEMEHIGREAAAFLRGAEG